MTVRDGEDEDGDEDVDVVVDGGLGWWRWAEFWLYARVIVDCTVSILMWQFCNDASLECK